MGQKISDGKAFDEVAPDATVINDYDLYRVGGKNGVAIGSKTADQEDRNMAFEMDTNAIYSIKVPAGLDPDVGMCLFWANPDIFQKGDTHLLTEPAVSGDAPCFWVTGEKNDAGYVQGRVLNGASGTAFQGS